MLKKINGSITKLLFYIKNNLVSCVFKFSILSTMLILVYLGCMLSQTDRASSSDSSGIYPIEDSQKLKLMIPTDTTSDSSCDNFDSSTEALEKINENSFSNDDDIFSEAHLVLPMQESTTTPMSLIVEEEKELQKVPEIKTVSNSMEESITEIELEMSATTEETAGDDIDHEVTTTTEVTTSIVESTTTELDNSVSDLPIKRSLSSSAIDLSNDASLETSSESQINMSPTTIIGVIEETTEGYQSTTVTPTSTSTSYDESVENVTNRTSTNSSTSTVSSTTTSKSISTTTTTTTTTASTNLPPVPENNLFSDDWTSSLSVENEDVYLDYKDGSSSHLNFLKEPSKSLFQNEDSESASTESIILKTNSNDTSEPETNSDTQNSNQIHYSNSEESASFFSPQNLFNLFSLDHQTSSSNIKSNWWPTSKSSSMSTLAAERSAKNQKRQTNRISRHDEGFQHDMSGNQLLFGQRFDTLLNRKLKNSVSMLERLFGNYFLQ